MANKNFSLTYYLTLRSFSGSCVWKDVNIEKKVKKLEKNCNFVRKNVKIRDVKKLKQLHYH